MNTKMVIGVIAVIAVVGAGAWYFSMKGSSTAGLQGKGNEQENAEGMGTFASLMARTGSWKCDVHTTAGAESNGTVHIADGKIRADFTSEIEGQGTVTSHMITADNTVYTWSDAYPQGMKIMISPNETETSGSSSSQSPVDPNADVDYSCMPWVVDSGMFIPPSNISFMELGENGIPSMDGMEIPQPY